MCRLRIVSAPINVDIDTAEKMQAETVASKHTAHDTKAYISSLEGRHASQESSIVAANVQCDKGDAARLPTVGISTRDVADPFEIELTIWEDPQ